MLAARCCMDCHTALRRVPEKSYCWGRQFCFSTLALDENYFFCRALFSPLSFTKPFFWSPSKTETEFVNDRQDIVFVLLVILTARLVNIYDGSTSWRLYCLSASFNPSLTTDFEVLLYRVRIGFPLRYFVVISRIAYHLLHFQWSLKEELMSFLYYLYY